MVGIHDPQGFPEQSRQAQLRNGTLGSRSAPSWTDGPVDQVCQAWHSASSSATFARWLCGCRCPPSTFRAVSYTMCHTFTTHIRSIVAMTHGPPSANLRLDLSRALTWSDQHIWAGRCDKALTTNRISNPRALLQSPKVEALRKRL
jgi:hypothetical protein